MMTVRTDFDAPGEPVEIQVYGMKSRPDGTSGLCTPDEEPEFWDIIVRGEPDAGGEIHQFVEYEDLTDRALVDFALARLGEQYPNLPVEWVYG